MIQWFRTFWARHKARYQEAVRRYGWPVIATAIGLNVVWIAVLVTAVKMGVQIDGVGGNAGLIGGAWVVSKPFLPVRLALAVLIAPPLVRQVRKWRGLDPDLPPVAPTEPVVAAESDGDAGR